MYRVAVTVAAACLLWGSRADAQIVLTLEETMIRARDQAGAVSVARARVAEAEGDPVWALRALRRRGSTFGGSPAYVSAYVREEARLAAITGDTAGARRAYRHYIGVNPSPEPRRRGDVEMARRALAHLERGGR